MNVLVTGGSGQLGRELLATLPAGCKAHMPAKSELDIRDRRQCEAALHASKAEFVINAAAWTDVDGAEEEAETAHAINALGAENIATAATQAGARVLHVSTDYVFDGLSSAPRRPADPVSPLGEYGRSKAEGERRVETASDGRAVILRTAWLYSAHGKNFVRTMLRLFGSGREVRVVADQVGTPTWARGLARAIWRIAGLPGLRGVFHWTDAGTASWYDFALAVQEEALALGLIGKAAPVIPISTAEYPTRAKRPASSVLDKSDCWRALGLTAPHWRVSLREMLAEEKPGA